MDKCHVLLTKADELLSNLFLYSSTIFDNSSLVNFFNALSDTAIANLKLHFKELYATKKSQG